MVGPQGITPSQICIILQFLRKSNPIIVLFIQNNTQFKKAKTCWIDAKFPSSFECFSERDVYSQQIFFKQQMSSVEMCSCYVFRQQFGYFFFYEIREMLFRHLLLPYPNNATSFPGLLGCSPFSSDYPVLLTSFSVCRKLQIWSTLAGYKKKQR